MIQGQCPVCESILGAPPDGLQVGDYTYFRCPNCGDFRLTGSVMAESPWRWTTSRRRRALLSYAIRRTQRNGTWPLIDSYKLDHIFETDYLPNAAEQTDLLLLILASRSELTGDEVLVDLDSDRASIGAFDAAGTYFVLHSLKESGLVVARESLGKRQTVQLAMAGWKVVQGMATRGGSGRLGFMAMPYGNEQLDRVYGQAFKPACKTAGFDLLRLDEKPQAGLIDVRLRAEIRRAQFLIADLSDSNPGAYWEAGYAEGLGRPVIYSCSKLVFDGKRTHFDTNHSQHVLWDPEQLEVAGEELTATLRATLPAVANFG